jgi:hypothetical protein
VRRKFPVRPVAAAALLMEILLLYKKNGHFSLINLTVESIEIAQPVFLPFYNFKENI